MAGRYVLSDYNTADDQTPKIDSRYDNLEEAEASFTKSAERKILSVVLYDTEKDEVLKAGIDGEPIYLVMAVEKAREEKKPNAVATATAKALAGIAIGEWRDRQSSIRCRSAWCWRCNSCSFSGPILCHQRRRSCSCRSGCRSVGWCIWGCDRNHYCSRYWHCHRGCHRRSCSWYSYSSTC